MKALACIGLVAIAGCTAGRGREDHILTIDQGHFPHYPGVLVSLDDTRVTPLPRHLEELKTTDADLWIEPRDPEIAAVTTVAAADLRITHVGGDAHVAVTTDTYAGITGVPARCAWLDRLPVEAISTGSVFLVQSSTNQYYKVRIDAWEQDAAGGSMRLSFAPISGP